MEQFFLLVIKRKKFTLKNIWVKRPGTGEILAKDLDETIGKIASINIPINTQLELSMFH